MPLRFLFSWWAYFSLNPVKPLSDLTLNLEVSIIYSIVQVEFNELWLNLFLFCPYSARFTQTRAISSTATQQGSTWVSPWWIFLRSASGYQKVCSRRSWKKRLKTRVKSSSAGSRSSFLIHSIWSDISSVLYLCPSTAKFSIICNSHIPCVSV